MEEKRAPGTLSEEAGAIWKDITGTNKLNAAQFVVLQTALEQYDLYMKFREEVAKAGSWTPARDGIKAHPGVAAMKTARDGFLAAWRMLGITLEVKDVGRPTDNRELEWERKLGLASSS